MSPGLVVLVLSLLLGMQPVTTDLYLPALPAIARDFGAVPAQAQLSLLALLLAFGIAQLVWGPLSDRIGRRRVLLLGLTGYTAAAIGSALSTSMEILVGWRILQGASMGAAAVCARAIVRDLYPPPQAAQTMSRGLSGLGIAAALGPLTGGVIADLFGWRATLFALALVGALVFFVIWRYFGETLREFNDGAPRSSCLIGRTTEIARSPIFWTFSLLSTCSTAGLSSFLISSSFLLIEQHSMTKTAYGFVLLSVSTFYIAGTMICRRALTAWGVRGTLMLGALLTLMGGAAMAGLAGAGIDGPWSLIVPVWIYMLGHGIHQPCGQSGAVAAFPAAAGTASALTGLAMMVTVFLNGCWIGAHMDGTAGAMSWAIAGWSLATSGVAAFGSLRGRKLTALHSL